MRKQRAAGLRILSQDALLPCLVYPDALPFTRPPKPCMNSRAHRRTRARHDTSGLGTVIRISLSAFRQVRRRTRSHPGSTPHAPPKRLKHPVTPWALASTNRRGVVRSRNQRGVPRTGQERNAGAREAMRAMMNTESPVHARQKRDDNDNRPQERRRATTNPGSASGGGGAPRTQFLSDFPRSDFNTGALYL